MQKFRKAVAVALTAMAIAGFTALPAMASEDEAICVSLRIEGVEETIYYNNQIEMPAGSSIADLVAAINDMDDAPDIEYDSSWYIQKIGDLAEHDYGGWSGWSFRLNDGELTSGINENFLANGDEVVCYYGDPWGEPGMQYPIIDISRLFTDSVILFTSIDVEYDDDWTPQLSENPVEGARVVVKGATFMTDENGAITIADKTGISGFCSVQIDRFDDETGVPTVLRFAPDFEIYVPFADMLDDPWYEDAVVFCVREWSYSGENLAENLFAPMRKMNMAELITVLARIVGVYDSAATEPWYETTYEWALESGIIIEEEFDALSFVTKEKFVHMFYLVVALTGDYDMTEAADITGAIDYSDIGAEYLEAISWAVASGIVRGVGDDELIIDPQEEFTRAMVCQFLYNFYA